MRSLFKNIQHSTRVKTPTVLQMEAVECGPASLAIVLGYFGRILPLEELRIACGVSREGSKAGNILKAARKHGLVAEEFQMEPEAVKSLRQPTIVQWGFNHFLVLEGFRNGRVYLNDPAFGPRVVTATEFAASFTGKLMIFEPGPDFKKGRDKPTLAKSLKMRLAGSEVALTYAVIAGLFLVIPGLIVPTFMRTFVDQYLVARMDSWVKPLLLAMALTVIIQAALTWLQKYYLLRLETKLALSTSSKFFWHILRLPIEFFTQRYGGEIGNRVRINDKVARLLSAELATTMISIVSLVFFAAIMFKYDVLLTLVGIFMAGLNLAALKYTRRKTVDGNKKLLMEQGKLTGISMNGLQMIETLKSTGAENDFFAQWSGYLTRTLNAQQRLGVPLRFLWVTPSLLAAINTTAILVIGGLRVMEGQLTMGMLVAFQALMASFMEPVNNLVNLGSKLQETEGDMNRLDDILRYETEQEPLPAARAKTGADSVIKLNGYLELRSITFGYSPLEEPLVENFSLRLKPGERVALVGGSGSGKSTIAKIVCGLYKAWAGEILFDGQPRQSLPRRLINNSLGLVDQEIFLFAGTVRENLTMWDSTIPESNLIQAAKDACIHEDVAARAGGYESRIDEGGRNFSGGQRQRLEIARALVSNPTLLVLDEATSALDPLTEKLIDTYLRRRGCTCLIVAHRLSTIRDCDEIIVLERGKVVQRGTHEGMKDIEGPYARLIAG